MFDLSIVVSRLNDYGNKWEQMIEAFLKSVGEALSAQRVSLFRNELPPDNRQIAIGGVFIRS